MSNETQKEPAVKRGSVTAKNDRNAPSTEGRGDTIRHRAFEPDEPGPRIMGSNGLQYYLKAGRVYYRDPGYWDYDAPDDAPTHHDCGAEDEDEGECYAGDGLWHHCTLEEARGYGMPLEPDAKAPPDNSCWHEFMSLPGMRDNTPMSRDEWWRWVKAGCHLDGEGRATIPYVSLGTSAADVRELQYRWAWKGWLCRGKFHIAGGKPGIGKSTVLCSLAGIQSVGGEWPDGSRATPGDVLIWSGEDGWEDTIVPRLRASGADLKRCYSLNKMTVQDEALGNRPFHIATDLVRLIEFLKSRDASQNVSLLIIDPLADVFLGAGHGASHNNVEVRVHLQKLFDLAEKRGIAIVGVIHVTKGTDGMDPLERLAGSGAFGAAPRMVWYIAASQEEGKPSRFVRLKTNIYWQGDAFEFTLEQLPSDDDKVPTQRTNWGRLLRGYARTLIEELEPKAEKSGTKLDRATRFILGRVGPSGDEGVSTRTLRAECSDLGFNWSTIVSHVLPKLDLELFYGPQARLNGVPDRRYRMVHRKPAPMGDAGPKKPDPDEKLW